MNIIGQYPEIRTYRDGRVEAIRFVLEGGITDSEIEQLKQEHEGYSGVLEHYLTLFVPPVDVQEVVAEKQAVQALLTTVAEALPDELAVLHPDIYPTLTQSGEAVPAGTRINWNGSIAKANVMLWDREDQDPENAPELWTILTIQGGYRVIPNPIPATETFAPGEIGLWEDGKLYKSVHPTPHAWTPADYPAAWEVVT